MDGVTFEKSNNFEIDHNEASTLHTMRSNAAVATAGSPLRYEVPLPKAASEFTKDLEAGMAKRCIESGLNALREEMQTSANRIRIGMEMKARKSELPHGKFKPYVESFNLNMRNVERCMRVADNFGRHCDVVAVLSFELLHDLCANGVPQEVRDTVISRLERGEVLTPNEIRGLIVKARGEQPKPRKQPKPSPVPSDAPEPEAGSSRVSDGAENRSGEHRFRVEQPDVDEVESKNESESTQYGGSSDNDQEEDREPPDARAAAMISGKFDRREIVELFRLLKNTGLSGLLNGLVRCGCITEAEAKLIDRDLGGGAGEAHDI